MKGFKNNKEIPIKRDEREQLREKGQFWTPEWVAEAMVEYVIENSKLIFDPAVGRGAFYCALKKLQHSNKKMKFYGTDIDKNIIKECLYEKNSFILELRDFIFNPPKRKFKSIIANPPYIRHHRLPTKTKGKLKEISKKILGFKIDGRAGLHIYFLIQALNLLETKGKLAFIMPADTCEGIFAKDLWEWITKNYCLECVITFLPKATPFPGVDTNAMVFLIKNKIPNDYFFWVLSKKADSEDLKYFIRSKFKDKEFPTLKITNRKLCEALKTGLSRPPLQSEHIKYRLSDFAKVIRGIATGANEFFFLTKQQAKKLKIPNEFLIPAIGRTRDIEGSTIIRETLTLLDKKGRPTLLFSLDGRKFEYFQKEVKDYILYGEKLGINQRALLKTRNPWYKMERREIPEFLFAYLGRRNSRFIKNEAIVVPLTGFLCVYTNSKDKNFICKFWEILKHPDIINNIRFVGKSYGAGAIKVEPRALENLPIPEYLVEKYNLKTIKRDNRLKSLFIL